MEVATGGPEARPDCSVVRALMFMKGGGVSAAVAIDWAVSTYSRKGQEGWTEGAD